MNRRQFLHTTAITAAASTVFNFPDAPAATAGVKWAIGCFNRPWVKWGFDAALDGIKAAGYHLTGLLTTTKGEAFIGSDATPEYLSQLKQRIAACRGGTPQLAWN